MATLSNIQKPKGNKLYTLSQLEKDFGMPFAFAKHLVYDKILRGVLINDIFYVTEESLRAFLARPKSERDAHHLSFFKKVGPGIVTGAADDDPSGIGTYSQVGSQFGLGLSWLALYLLPMMTAVQETCARIGIVTGKGLAGALTKRFNKKIVFVLVILLVIANTINIGADLGAIAASFRMVTHCNYILAAIVFAALIIFLEVFVSYHRYSKILKWLVLSLLAYLLCGFLIRPDWLAVGRSLVVPHLSFDLGFLMANVAVIGTTISPYLFFWQSSQEIEEEKEKGILNDHRVAIVKEEIRVMRKDVVSGMSIANLTFLFIVITTAFVLYNKGITNIETAEQAASALEPLAGRFASIIFTIGIVGTGLLAIPVLAGASAYAISELFKWREGLSLKFKKAHGFYGIVIASTLVGLIINFIGINPISALFYSAVINGIIASILLVFIFLIGNDRNIMGKHTNPLWVKIFGGVAIIFMAVSSGLLIFTLLF